MKLGLVVQRYGAKINGGAELHARYIAELLARHHKVEVLTTCASDYITWRNELPAGTETLRGVTIRRFPVSRERDPRQFGHHSQQVFERKHSLADEIAWLESEGPTCPALIEHLRTHGDDYDYVIFFSYRYYQAYHGARAVPGKAILVPTAERDAAAGLGIFGPLFRGVRAIMYNSHEERAMIRGVAHNDQVPGVIVGVGSDVPRSTSPDRFRKKFDVQGPFVIYVGRIDENKGCKELFSFFTGYRPRLGQRLQLLLIGNSILPIPNHPNIRHLGYVSDQDKFDAIAAADALMMPSYYESLSMVALEAWALGRPVLANGKCDVLRGQCVRSRAGLYYENFHEFCEALFTLTTNRALNDALGENGRRFYEQNYAWPVIERKYLDILKRLQQEDAGARRAKGSGASSGSGMEPLPGWLTRQRRTLAPSMQVVNALPQGPALDEPSSSVGADLAASGGRYDSARANASTNDDDDEEYASADASAGSTSRASSGSSSGSGSGSASESGSASSAHSSPGHGHHSTLGRPSQGDRGDRRDRGDRSGRGDRSDRGRSTRSESARPSEGETREGEAAGREREREQGRERERETDGARDAAARPVERQAREGRESRPPREGDRSRDRDRNKDRNRDRDRRRSSGSSGSQGNSGSQKPSGSDSGSGSGSNSGSGSSSGSGSGSPRPSSRHSGGRGSRGRGGRSGGSGSGGGSRGGPS